MRFYVCFIVLMFRLDLFILIMLRNCREVVRDRNDCYVIKNVILNHSDKQCVTKSLERTRRYLERQEPHGQATLNS